MSYKIVSEEVSDKLCGLCTVSLDVCSASRSSGNAFAGNDGALECMAAGQGDVAFVKHTTLQEAADKWNASDYHHYQYLCKDGTREGKSLVDLVLQKGRGSQKKCFSALRASVLSKTKPPPPPPPCVSLSWIRHFIYIKAFSIYKSWCEIKCRSRFQFGTRYWVYRVV